MSETYTPDSLIAGNEFPALTVEVTVAAGQVLDRGAVVGVVTADGTVALVDKAETDGTQTAVHVMAEAVDATAGAKKGVAFDTGIFNAAALSFTSGTVVADVRAALRSRSIFLRTVRSY